MAQKYTESRKESNRRWDAQNLDRISFTLKKGRLDAVRRCAEQSGESVNRYIGRIVEAAINSEPPVVLNRDAMEAAKKATSDTGETISEYVNRAVITLSKSSS